MTEHWGAYIRVSTRHQAEDGWSLEGQREKLIAYGEEQGWTVSVYEDPGRSGESLEGRPGMLALLDAVDARKVVGVLVLDESRLARDDVTAALIRDRLRRAGARLAMPGRGELDLSDPASSFVAGILGQAAAFEQQLRTSKMIEGLRRTVEKGYWPGGPAPFGYRLADIDGTGHKKLIIDDEEAAVLRLVAKLILDQGHSTYGAAAYLNARGYTTRRGSPWRHPNLCHQLRYTHLTGTWMYRQGGDPIEMEIPAIFEQAEWDEIQASIKGRSRPQQKQRHYPLSGRNRRRLYCACGSSMSGMIRKSHNRRAYYVCSKASWSYGGDRCALLPKTYRAVELESAVWNELLSTLTDPTRLRALAHDYLKALDQPQGNGSRRRALEGRLGDLKREQTAIVRRKAASGSLDALDDALAEIQEEEAALRHELAEIRREDVLVAGQAAMPERIDYLVAACETLLIAPDDQLMGDIFDMLEVRLDLVEPYRFEGTASVPLPQDIDGQFQKEGLQRP